MRGIRFVVTGAFTGRIRMTAQYRCLFGVCPSRLSSIARAVAVNSLGVAGSVESPIPDGVRWHIGMSRRMSFEFFPGIVAQTI